MNGLLTIGAIDASGYPAPGRRTFKGDRAAKPQQRKHTIINSSSSKGHKCSQMNGEKVKNLVYSSLTKDGLRRGSWS